MLTLNRPPKSTGLRKPLGGTLACDFPGCSSVMPYGPDLCQYARTIALPDGWYTGTINCKPTMATLTRTRITIDLCSDCADKFKTG